MKVKKILIVLLMILTLITASIFSFYIYINTAESETIGTDDTGSVIKTTYSHHDNSKVKIAIISGMHPRETLSLEVLPEVAKVYAAFNDVEIINYRVNVTANPENFIVGRSNGEYLVYNYIVKDIAESDIDCVIIGHDHEPGYGEGFYVATPTMDTKSLAIGEVVANNNPSFKHYTRSTNKKTKSSSIKIVDEPIVKTGVPVLVYEIPEWENKFTAFSESYDLLDICLKYYSQT